MGIKKQTLKKLLHDYSLVVVVFIGLIVTLLILAGIRLFALISIGDLSNINPLITSGQNTLAVKDGTSEIIKIPIEEGPVKSSNSGDKSEKGGVGPETPKGSGSAGNKNSSQGGSGNNTSGGATNPGEGNGGSGGTNPNPTPTPTPTPPPPPAFTASISNSVQHTDTYISESGFIFKKCKLKHKFIFTINAQNAPGGTPAKAQWKWLDYDWGYVFDVPFAAGQTSNTVWYEWELNDYPGTKEVKLRLTSPNSQTVTHRFYHEC